MTLLPGLTNLPLQTRKEPLGEVDAAARTIEVIWTTGASVRRNRWDGYDNAVRFDEVLLVTDAAIDLTRLKNSAPVLDSHAAGSVAAQRAVVDDAWLSGGKGYARLRFPTIGTDPEADRLFEMARQKIIRNISVGYAINKVRVVPAKSAAEVEQRIIERWTPYELSFVTIPADAGAQTRGGPGIGEAGAALARMKLKARCSGLRLPADAGAQTRGGPGIGGAGAALNRMKLKARRSGLRLP